MKHSIVWCSIIAINGCSFFSSGVRVDSISVSKIQSGITTKAEMLLWFGVPRAQSMDTSRKSVLSWSYTETQTDAVTMQVKHQILSVLFDANDVVEKFSLIDDTQGTSIFSPAAYWILFFTVFLVVSFSLRFSTTS